MDSAFCTRNRNSIIKSVQRDDVYITADNIEHALILSLELLAKPAESARGIGLSSEMVTPQDEKPMFPAVEG
jgi:hypothetical protein